MVKCHAIQIYLDCMILLWKEINMVTKEQINRINILAKKSKTSCLSDEEKEEQKILRELYIKSFKENLISQLDSIEIVDEDSCSEKK